MDFLEERRAIASLNETDITTQRSGEGDDDLVRFRVDRDDAATLSIAVRPAADADFKLNTDSGAAIAELLDDVLHAMHIQSALVVPVGRWRAVLDLVAFDLAADEDWREIDAEASLHQRSRDPLEIPPDQRQTMLRLVAAVLNNGDAEQQDITILAPGVGVIIDVRHPAELRVTTANRVTLESLAGKLGAA